MKNNKWLLPPSIEDILPDRGDEFLQTQNQLLKIIQSHGYKMVYPPLVEYAFSLNIHESHNLDADIARFSLGDSASSAEETDLGLRADFTPQCARMDAAMMGTINSDGTDKTNHKEVNRMCYAGETFRAKNIHNDKMASGFHIGAELFGDKSLNADLEIIDMALECLMAIITNNKGKKAKDSNAISKEPILFLSHATFARALATMLLSSNDKETDKKLNRGLSKERSKTNEQGMSENPEEEYLALLATKSQDYIERLLDTHATKPNMTKITASKRQILAGLSRLYGDEKILAQAKELIKPLKNKRIEAMLELVIKATEHFKNKAKIYIDLGEMPGNGYSYHNGLVFGIYFRGSAECFAEGGRYDAINEYYAKTKMKQSSADNDTKQSDEYSRGATGFSIDLKQVLLRV